jgi:glutathione S-transferase
VIVEEDLANRSEFLKSVNPLAKVPTLEIGDGRIIFDSYVVMQYCVEVSGRQDLWP